MARSRDYKSIRYDSAIDGHCAACSSSNLRQASSNRRSMSRGWLAERTGTTRVETTAEAARCTAHALLTSPHSPTRTTSPQRLAARASQAVSRPTAKTQFVFFLTGRATMCFASSRAMPAQATAAIVASYGLARASPTPQGADIL